MIVVSMFVVDIFLAMGGIEEPTWRREAADDGIGRLALLPPEGIFIIDVDTHLT